LFEKGWLSADVGFTMVKRSILKIKGPKINIKNTIQQTKNMFEIGVQNMKKLTKRDHKLDPKGSPKLEKTVPKKEWNPDAGNGVPIVSNRTRTQTGGSAVAPRPGGTLGPIYIY